MPKLPLVGGAYPAISAAAAAQTCVNLIPEPIEDKSEAGKGGGILIGAPGKHLFKDLTVIDAGATPYRGSLMVNGRLFVAAGTKFFEIDSNGALVGSIFTITYDAANPAATMYSNGGAQQIMIITAGLCHMFDGFSMNIIDLPAFTGRVLTDGKTVYWQSGDKFDSSMTGQPITIAGRSFTVAVVNSPDVLTLTTTFTLTVSAATNANPVVLTTSVNHGLATGASVLGSGFIGGFASLNGAFTPITVTAVNQFSIAVDSTAFGAYPGNGLIDVYDAAYASTIPHMRSISGCVLDGYFMVAREDSTKVNISPLLDGGNNGTWVWDQLDFANKESTPGYLRSVLAANEQLYVFGVDGFEVWQNTGAASFPFQRIDGATGNIGSISRWGPIQIEGKVFYIGGSAGQIVAYVLNGYTPRRISTYAEEAAWNSASLGVDCISYTYLEEGHTFWVINFGAQTWVYDVTTGIWHQRYAWSGAAFTAFLTKYHTFAQNSHGCANNWGANGAHLVGGDGTGKIYQQSLSFYDDVGADMAWQRTLPYQYAAGKRIYFGRMMLEYETGAVASGAEPTVSRSYSDDRGQTFSTPQTAGVGVHADTGKRVFWPTGGSNYNRLWRLFGSGQSKVALVCLDSEQEAGAN